MKPLCCTLKFYYEQAGQMRRKVCLALTWFRIAVIWTNAYLGFWVPRCSMGLVGWYSRKFPIENCFLYGAHSWVQGSWNAKKVQDVPRWWWRNKVKCLNWNSGLNGHKDKCIFTFKWVFKEGIKSGDDDDYKCRKVTS